MVETSPVVATSRFAHNSRDSRIWSLNYVLFTPGIESIRSIFPRLLPQIGSRFFIRHLVLKGSYYSLDFVLLSLFSPSAVPNISSRNESHITEVN